MNLDKKTLHSGNHRQRSGVNPSHHHHDDTTLFGVENPDNTSYRIDIGVESPHSVILDCYRVFEL